MTVHMLRAQRAMNDLRDHVGITRDRARAIVQALEGLSTNMERWTLVTRELVPHGVSSMIARDWLRVRGYWEPAAPARHATKHVCFDCHKPLTSTLLRLTARGITHMTCGESQPEPPRAA